jgi:TolB-like protein
MSSAIMVNFEDQKMSGMSTTATSRELERVGPRQARLVNDHLQELLASRSFAGSKRAQDFLRLIVRHALAGEYDSLRERMIGAEMFNRPVDYDTANDGVVRVKATEVRKKLTQFYLESRREYEVQIELPSGSYVPRFIFSPGGDVAETRVHFAPGVQGIEAVAPGRGRLDSSRFHSGVEESLQIPFSWKELVRRRGVIPSIALCVLVLAGYTAFHSYRVRPRPIYSIAILPFKNLSSNAGQDYFADGMTEQLIADIGQIPALRVISSTSAMSFKSTKKSLPEIARELGVEGIVEGSVLREDGQARITVRLVDPDDGRLLWTHAYVRDLPNMLALQGELAQAIADEVRINLTPQTQAQLARTRQVDAEAEDLYLQGMLRLNEGNRAGAMDLFQKAVQADPNFAQVHAAMANCYGWMGESGSLGYEAAFLNQYREAARAVELDDALSDAHAELAYAAMNLNWDWATAAKEFRRALELNPNSAVVHETYAGYLERTGNPAQGIVEAEIARKLDPISHRSLNDLGYAYYCSRQYERALSLFKRAQALDAAVEDNGFLLGNLYAQMGMYDKSIAEFTRLGDGSHAVGHLGYAYALAGRRNLARKTIEQLKEHVLKNGVGRYEMALVYAALGEKDEAFNWLDAAFAERDKGLTYIKIDPCLDSLRSDSRFNDLVRRVGVTP